MPVFVGYCHLLYDFLDGFIGGFHCAIHLWSIWRGIMMLDLEMCAEFSNHLLFRFVPLSVMILSGMPYRQMRLFLMNRATTFLVTEANEAASTHFVK